MRDQWECWLDGGDGDPFGVGEPERERLDPRDDGDREREERHASQEEV